ncbi:hypothetical protein ACFQZJ_01060 [Maribacter chungangensis]|uniref:Uncharacterized protein n=1 Tax=Maribacter chungangensis TaxID=1069117 RepID=A0ABW3AZX1_9FLAO
MKTNPIYTLLKAALLCSVLVVIYGCIAYVSDIDFFRGSLPYAVIAFQVVVLLIMLYKIVVNIVQKKPIGNLLGVTAALAIAFIGATYLYIAIMDAITK